MTERERESPAAGDARPYNPLAIDGRTYLVTGASSGIGQAIAVTLSRLGGRVICAGRNVEQLERTRAALAGTGHAVEAFDLRQVDDIPGWMQDIATRHGRLNGLVHAAGVNALVPVEMLSAAAVRDVLAVNAEAALALAGALRKKRVYAGEHGAVVFISSVMGLVGAAATAAYAMSKGALHALARALAVELARDRIRVNCVAPAMVRTPLAEQMQARWSDQQRAEVERMHPLGLGEPDDVAQAVAFLVADTGRWITGTVLVVDGGYTAA